MKIRHSGLVVKDIKKSIFFWTKLIGFKVYLKKKESGDVIDKILNKKNCKITTVKLIDTNKNILELIAFEGKYKSISKKINTNTAGFTHIALTVDNLDKIYKKLVKNKIIFNSAPLISQDNKVKLTYLKTPEGAYLELVEELV